MSVMGELGDFHVAGILQMLSLQRSTGRLQVTSAGDELVIFMADGKIIQVTSNRLSLRLGRVLEQRGLVRPHQLRAALRQQADQPGRGIGEILIEQRWVSPEDVADCLEEQCVLMMVRVMAANTGTFVYNSGVMPNVRAMMPLNTDRILLDATRRVDELNKLRELLPDRKQPLSISARLDLDMVPLRPIESRIVAALRAGATSIEHLADLLPFDEPTLLRTLIDLHARGLVISGYGTENTDLGMSGGSAPGEADLLRILPRGR